MGLRKFIIYSDVDVRLLLDSRIWQEKRKQLNFLTIFFKIHLFKTHKT